MKVKIEDAIAWLENLLAESEENGDEYAANFVCIAISAIKEKRICANCGFCTECEPRCLCDKSQWSGKTVSEYNYCMHFEVRNDPLTIEEMRQMDGEPVWDNFHMEWCIIMMDLCFGKGAVRYFGGGFNRMSENRFYRHKPEEGNNAD